MLKTIKKLSSIAIDFFLPPRCPGCMQMIDKHYHLCFKCWSQVEFVSRPKCKICGTGFEFEINFSDPICGDCLTTQPYFDKARHLFKYNALIQSLVKKFKFNGEVQLGACFANWLVNNYFEFIEDNNLIAPVPMHKYKRLLRGYNQSLELSRRISGQLAGKINNTNGAANLPLHRADLILKAKYTKPQTSLSRTSRQKNLIGSMYVNPVYKTMLKGKNVLLIDDVITTGATAGEISKLLKRAGASKVNILSIAKTHIQGT